MSNVHRLKFSKRLMQARKIKNAALAIIERHGQRMDMSGHSVDLFYLHAEHNGLQLSLWHPPAGQHDCQQVIDICPSNGHKCFSFGWGPVGNESIINFKRGDWENLIAA